MVSACDVIWLVGYLEGEGSFTFNKNVPVLSVISTDEDVVQRVANLTKQELKGPYMYGHNRKPFWRVQLVGAKAIGWMFTIYYGMSLRRRSQIRFVIDEWKKVGTSRSSLTRNRNGFPTVSGL
mgnify:CR=1 FL=1